MKFFTSYVLQIAVCKVCRKLKLEDAVCKSKGCRVLRKAAR